MCGPDNQVLSVTCRLNLVLWCRSAVYAHLPSQCFLTCYSCENPFWDSFTQCKLLACYNLQRKLWTYSIFTIYFILSILFYIYILIFYIVLCWLFSFIWQFRVMQNIFMYDFRHATILEPRKCSNFVFISMLSCFMLKSNLFSLTGS